MKNYNNKLFYLALFLVFSLGIFLRIYKVSLIPPGLHGDEAQSGLEALKIINGTAYEPYSSEVYGQTTFYFYLVAGIFKIFGVSATSIRLTSVILGILTIPLFYFCIKNFFNQRLALISTFFLTISRWHLHLSRLGLMTIMMTLFQAGLFLFLFKGLKTQKKYYFLLAGLFLALGLNSYMGFRLIPFLLLIFAVFLILKKPKILIKNKVGIIIFLLSGLIFCLPLTIYAFRHWDIFMGRIDSIWIFDKTSPINLTSHLWQNFKGIIVSFNFAGSTWPHKNLPGAPMIDAISSLFFLIGFFLTFWRIKRPLYFLLLINLFIFSAASLLSINTYSPSLDPIRSSGALFSVIVLTGLGFDYIWKKLKLKLIRIFLIILLLISGVLNFQSYFLKFAKSPSVWHDFHFVPVEVAKVANQNPTSYIYLLSDWFYIDYLSIKFISPYLPGENFFEKINEYSPKTYLLPLKASTKKDALFIILPFYKPYLLTLKDYYPEGEIKNYFGGPEEKIIFTTFFVPQYLLN